MADNARGIHVSPGIYSKETELTYAVKSLGITTLGLVGETLRGPAFQPMLVENWREFQSIFGGTSPEKYQGSQYPKYELPYIAKSYLTESNQLQVCRVLGLSGYNAGPAWAVTAKIEKEGEANNGKEMIIAILRSRGYYESYHKYSATTGDCNCPQQSYDTLFYNVGEIEESQKECKNAKLYNLNALKIDEYTPIDSEGNECEGYKITSGTSNFKVSSDNYGKFKIVGVTGPQKVETFELNDKDANYFEYPVSFNPNDKEYILKVLGTNPTVGDAPIYVESLYDVALQQMIESGKIKEITSGLTSYQVYNKSDFCFLENVDDIMTKQEESLTRKFVGRRYLADKAAKDNNIQCHKMDYKTKKFEEDATTVEPGQIYTVKQYTDESGKRHYYYSYYSISNNGEQTADNLQHVTEVNDKLLNVTEGEQYKINENRFGGLVKCNYDGKYYRLTEDKTDIAPVENDMNDYRDSYRFASTPWIVSNIKGDYKNIELNKLFRFHTISDGSASNYEVKVSIQNIILDEGVFDVIVRDLRDTDDSQIVLEKFTRCTMSPNTPNYIAYKIGSYDGTYESKSKYITVEVNETDAAINSVPAGFLGYPLSRFNGLPVVGEAKEDIISPIIKYNLNFDNDIKHRKQYFGLSNITGVDVDMFTYKGNAAYSQEPEYLSQGFHLDSRLNEESYDSSSKPIITVDGIKDYKFDAISTNNRTHVLENTPVIGTEKEMAGSIYEYVDLRKFTVYFYGGFDGWDVYRQQRSNDDNFKLSKYKGDYNKLSGNGSSFDKISNPELLKLNQDGITSDFYAYLSAIRQFANPDEIDINVFATPGIDLINHKLLSQEVIEMLEEERADSIYVANIPDKPNGASDYINEMYTPEDIVDELDETEIDSNYTCTYYPWIKYEDVDNNQYVYLSPTKDVVRNMAMTDNTTHPWFAPAGVTRGDVNCVRAHYVTKLSDEDVLYEGRINPVKTFASDGVKIWGQKNLQKRESQLNRIAVRRLLLRMRKLIAISCIGLIFEPNDATIKNKFLSTVTPILDNIKSNRGISDYRIEVNDSLEARERRELPAKIFFKPYNALEYIDLDFILTPEGVSFDNI